MNEYRTDSTRASLQTLPLELQWQIYELLDYPSALFLASTCQSIRSSPKNPLTFNSNNNRAMFMSVAEHLPQHSNRRGYACFRCNVVKPRDHFSVTQVLKKRDKGNVQSFCRFCIDCGLSKNIYSRGQQVQKADGLVHWKCFSCATLKGPFCFACTKCSDYLGLTAGFGENECPSCGKHFHSESNRLAEYLNG
jgi:hypothetical protein